MPAYTPLHSADDFRGGGYFVEWAAHPPDYPPNPLMPGTAFHAGNAVYDYRPLGLDQIIRIDVLGPPVSLSVADDTFVAGLFTPGESLLVGDNQPSKMPVHLSFEPPVCAVGARVAAVGNAGEPFLATLNVRDPASGAWFGTSQPGVVSLAWDVAPFVGLRAGGLIDEIWCDVMSPGNQHHFPQVLVGTLYFRRQ